MSYIEQETDRKKYKTRILLLEFLDGISIVFATFIGVWTRYDFSLRSVPIYYVNALYRFIPIIIISTYIVYYFTRLYKSLWRFASITEAYRIAIAYVILGVVYLLTMLIPSARLPISSLFITYLLALMFCFILRFGYRIIGFIDRKRTKAEVIQENVLIIGAGPGGIFTAYELEQNAGGSLKTAVFELGNPLSGRKCPIDGERIKSCIRCRKCERECPQSLPITDLLKEVAATFE